MPHSYITRDIEGIVKTSARQFPALIITGPRQSGKTTLLKHLFLKDYTYVAMDAPALRLMAREEPDMFFQNHKPPLIIDEIQYAPELLSHIKIMIDKKRSLAGQFLLTGSQVFPLMAKVSESLAGRIAVFNLLSFSLREQFGSSMPNNIQLLKEKVLKGGFPEVSLKKGINLEVWFSSYLQTYLERDVRQLRQIGDLGDFQRFLQLLAAFNGQAINLSNFSRDLGVAVNTIKAWISILEASGQIITIKPFYMNKGKRIIKSPKVYFLDTGLLCYLSGIVSVPQVFKGPLSGQLLETIVLCEIIRDFHSLGKIPRIFWWRTSYGEEVDFIIEDKGKLIPIEVKLSAKADTKIIKGLSSFCALFSDKIDTAYLVNLASEKLILGKQIVSMPFFELINKPLLSRPTL
ncbi:MAG: ATP-binding protein [Candidatus Omnitrophota bacterium]